MPSRREFLKSAAAVVATGPALRSRARRAAGPPNILFVFPDQHRHDWTGANPGLAVRTPALDGLAARGVRFDRAYCASPLCGPSRACLAAGREYDTCGVPNHSRNDYPLDQPTFYRMLRQHGYHVMGCGKFDLHKSSPTWGVDGQHLLGAWGFSAGVDNAGKWDAVNAGREAPRDPYMAYLERNGLRTVHVADMDRRRDVRAVHPTPLPEAAYCDNWIGQNGLDLLAAAPQGRPWFLQVNFTGPHSPWDVTRRMATDARALSFGQPFRGDELTDEEHVAVRQNYAAMIENIDRWLGRYLDVLRRRGELDNTLVVFSSDHGEMLGDRGRWGKVVPYEASVGVPLVLAGPGVRAGHRSAALVSLIDLTATFLDVGGAPPLDGMQGRSLTPLLAGRTDAHRDVVRSGLYGWRMVRQGPHKLIVGHDEAKGVGKNDGAPDLGGPTLLYDLTADPWEANNLAAARPDLVRRLAERLVARA